MVYELSNMTWIDAEDKFKQSKLAIVPTGAMEQHGPHLGLGADWLQAWTIADKVGKKINAMVLPVMPYGISGHHADFPGVMTLTASTFRNVISDILTSLNRYGITKVVFINGHGGNLGALSEAARDAREKYGMVCAISQWWDVLQKPIFGQQVMAHAGYSETALMLASRPEAVKMELALLSPTTQIDEEIQLVSLGSARFRGGTIRMPLRTADVSISGSMTEYHPDDAPGTKDYSKITAEFAETLMDEVVDWLCEFIPRFEKLEIPPISVTREKALEPLKK